LPRWIHLGTRLHDLPHDDRVHIRCIKLAALERGPDDRGTEVWGGDAL
jgi:hypothetical protein